jgi:hypothetical protein
MRTTHVPPLAVGDLVDYRGYLYRIARVRGANTVLLEPMQPLDNKLHRMVVSSSTVRRVAERNEAGCSL